jgi:hypothetical protein
MILDGHIHIHGGAEGRAEFAGRLRAAGVDGGVLISGSPVCSYGAGRACTNSDHRARLNGRS